MILSCCEQLITDELMESVLARHEQLRSMKPYQEPSDDLISRDGHVSTNGNADQQTIRTQDFFEELKAQTTAGDGDSEQNFKQVSCMEDFRTMRRYQEDQRDRFLSFQQHVWAGLNKRHVLLREAQMVSQHKDEKAVASAVSHECS